MKKHLFILVSILICILPINIYAKEGWIKENGETYYYKNDTKLEGFQQIDGKTYFFGIGTKRLLHGWQIWNGKFYADPNTGEIKQGWQHIGVEDYYTRNNYMLEGFQQIDGKTYFFGIGSKRLLHGWQIWNGKFYADPNTGEIKQGWQHIGAEDYYTRNNYMLEGMQHIDGKIYFFGIGSKRLLHGWQNTNGNYWYQQDDGSLITGRQTVDGREYDFGTNGIVQGFKVINGKKYYYDVDGKMLTGVQNLCGQKMLFNAVTGAFEKIVSQKIVIDVSHHQATAAKGDINWTKVKNSGKVDGVIVRIGYSTIMDTKAKSFISELNRLGIPYGVYLFSYAENANEASKEADFVIEALKETKANINNNLGIFYDLETWDTSKASSRNISKQEYHNMITTFYNKVTGATGKRVGVYASKFYVYDRFLPEDKKYVNWVAHYTNGGLSQPTDYNGTYIGWQFTSTARVNGITGDVDMSLFYY